MYAFYSEAYRRLAISDRRRLEHELLAGARLDASTSESVGGVDVAERQTAARSSKLPDADDDVDDDIASKARERNSNLLQRSLRLREQDRGNGVAEIRPQAEDVYDRDLEQNCRSVEQRPQTSRAAADPPYSDRSTYARLPGHEPSVTPASSPRVVCFPRRSLQPQSLLPTDCRRPPSVPGTRQTTSRYSNPDVVTKHAAATSAASRRSPSNHIPPICEYAGYHSDQDTTIKLETPREYAFARRNSQRVRERYPLTSTAAADHVDLDPEPSPSSVPSKHYHHDERGDADNAKCRLVRCETQRLNREKFQSIPAARRSSGVDVAAIAVGPDGVTGGHNRRDYTERNIKIKTNSSDMILTNKVIRIYAKERSRRDPCKHYPASGSRRLSGDLYYKDSAATTRDNIPCTPTARHPYANHDYYGNNEVYTSTPIRNGLRYPSRDL